jgi:hypothetical protein
LIRAVNGGEARQDGRAKGGGIGGDAAGRGRHAGGGAGSRIDRRVALVGTGLGVRRLEGIAHPPSSTVAGCLLPLRRAAVWPSVRFAVALRSPTCRGVLWAQGAGRSAPPGEAKRPTPAGCGDGKGVRRQRMSRSRLEDEGDAGCGRQRDRGRQDSRRFGRARVTSQWMKARMDPQSNGGHHKLSISDGLRVSG